MAFCKLTWAVGRKRGKQKTAGCQALTRSWPPLTQAGPRRTWGKKVSASCSLALGD